MICCSCNHPNSEHWQNGDCDTCAKNAEHGVDPCLAWKRPQESERSWIQSTFGEKLPLLHLKPEDIDIRDIAYSLAGINRFSSRAQPRVNVAEHSYRVSKRCEELAAEMASRDSFTPYPFANARDYILNRARWGLLHDAAEAFVGDMTRPLKYQPALAGYREIEKRVEAAIVERFQLGPEPPEVAIADDEILWTEARDCCAPVHPEWGAHAKHGPLEHVNVEGWSPEWAEMKFLMRFYELFPEEK